jgi:hypothetical protein
MALARMLSSSGDEDDSEERECECDDIPVL